MLYTCKDNKSNWRGEIQIICNNPKCKEAIITSRGTDFYVITGRYHKGIYLCVPNLNIGCEIVDPEDICWNREKISMQLSNQVDTESLVYGLRALYSIK